MKHEFEGWRQAPEGATHFCVENCFWPWLKKEGEVHSYYNQRRSVWEGYGNLLGNHFKTAIPKPERFENVRNYELELDWKKAPPGATHILYGTWRRVTPERGYYWDLAKQEWCPCHTLFDGPGFIERWKRDIIAAPWFEGLPQAEKVQAAPARKQVVPEKKQVGWWS